MKSFKSVQAKYSKRIHAAISSVPATKWASIRDTAIELAAGVAAVWELAGDMVKHSRFVRTAAAAARG